jgi:hypothetical protein
MIPAQPICGLPNCVALAIFCLLGSLAEAGWKAGLAKADITPDKPMWMSGYAARNHRAEGSLTKLWGKALVIEDSSGKRIALVTLDLVGIDRTTSNAMRDRMVKEHGLERGAIALFCSHTHSGPVVGNNLMSMYTLSDEDQELVRTYTAGLIDEVVTAVGQAISDLAPAELGWASGKTGFAVNRRTNKEAEVPELRAANALLGPNDHQVPVLQISENDRVKAIVFGYACHATTLDYYDWCGDWPGYAMAQLEDDLPGTTAFFWAGCGADQNPLPRRTGNPDAQAEKTTRVGLAKRYGDLLATEVMTAMSSNITPITGDLDLRYEEPELDFASVPTAEEVEAQLGSKNIYEAGRAKMLKQEIAARGSVAPSYPYPIQTWKLGDGPVWVTLGGEVVVDYSIRLKTEIRMVHGGDRPVWVAGYANDVMAYIPSVRVLREGGYEGESSMLYYGRPSRWAESVEEKIVTTVHAQVNSLLKPVK